VVSVGKVSFSSQMLPSANYTFIPKSGTRLNFIILALLFLLFLYAFLNIFVLCCGFLYCGILVEEVRLDLFTNWSLSFLSFL